MHEFNPHFIIPSVVFYFINSLASTSFNVMVLWSILKEPSLHLPSKILLCSLSLTDLILGSLSQILFAIYCISAMNRWESVFCATWSFNRRLGYCLVVISVITLTIMSIDRYLAVTTKTSYKTIVTKKRVLFLLLVSWCGSTLTVLVAIQFFDVNVLSSIAGVSLLICLVIIIFTFSGSCVRLRKLTNQVVQSLNFQPTNQTNFNIGKYRASLVTMVMILGLTVLSYVPSGIVVVGKALTNAKQGAIYFVHTGQMLVFLSSTINPLFYIWRMSDLRGVVKRNLLLLKAKICC